MNDKMTVSQLIALLQQCDPSAEVTWDYDGMTERPTAIQRLGREVQLRTDDPETLTILRERLDVLWP